MGSAYELVSGWPQYRGMFSKSVGVKSDPEDKIGCIGKQTNCVVSFLFGKSPASVYYCMPMFRNSQSVPSSKAMVEH